MFNTSSSCRLHHGSSVLYSTVLLLLIYGLCLICQRIDTAWVSSHIQRCHCSEQTRSRFDVSVDAMIQMAAFQVGE